MLRKGFEMLQLKMLQSNREAIVNIYFEELQEMDFHNGIRALRYCW